MAWITVFYHFWNYTGGYFAVLYTLGFIKLIINLVLMCFRTMDYLFPEKNSSFKAKPYGKCSCLSENLVQTFLMLVFMNFNLWAPITIAMAYLTCDMGMRSLKDKIVMRYSL